MRTLFSTIVLLLTHVFLTQVTYAAKSSPQMHAVLDELSSRAPEHVALASIIREGNQLTLVGYVRANDVLARFISQLGKSSILKNAELADLRSFGAAGGGRWMQFGLSAQLISSHPPGMKGVACTDRNAGTESRPEVPKRLDDLIARINETGTQNSLDWQNFSPCYGQLVSPPAALELRFKFSGHYENMRRFFCVMSESIEMGNFVLTARNNSEMEMQGVMRISTSTHENSTATTRDAACPLSKAVKLFDISKVMNEAPADPPGGTPVHSSLRSKQALENYPLESIKMFGAMEKKRVLYALMMVDDTLHQVKVGDYVGQNSGLIIDIKEDVVVVKELAGDTQDSNKTTTKYIRLTEMDRRK